VPFSECDPTKDTYAFANQEYTRVVPQGSYRKTGDLYCKPSLNPPWYSEPTKTTHSVSLGQALTCKANGPATTYLTPCPIPAAWKTCVTKTEPASNPYSGNEFAYIKIRPKVVNGVANGSQAYCWQAYPEIWRRTASTKNPDPNPPMFERNDDLLSESVFDFDKCKSSDCFVGVQSTWGSLP
jgi:hypothetical protein